MEQSDQVPYNPDLLEYIYSFLTDERKDAFERVLKDRTNYATVVLENIYKSQNASAILRTAECFGIQQIHYVLEKYGNYDVNYKVVKGADKWMTIKHAFGLEKGFNELKAQGFRLVATSPYATQTLDDLDISQKTAFIFGEERFGLSDKALELVDETISIPMFGFTDSFNISVSAGVCLSSFLTKLRKSEGINWQLSESEKNELRMEWALKSIKNPENYVQRFLEERGE